MAVDGCGTRFKVVFIGLSLNVRGKRRVPHADESAAGLRTTCSASTSVVRAAWHLARPVRQRADSQRQTCRSGALIVYTWELAHEVSRPLSRFVDFGEVSETCAPVSNEAKRPSRSAQYRLILYGDEVGYFKAWLARAAKPRFHWRGCFAWLTAKKETKRHVRTWHKADVRAPPFNVCFQGKNGHQN